MEVINARLGHASRLLCRLNLQNKRCCPYATPFEIFCARNGVVMRFFDDKPYNLAAACLCVFIGWWRVSLWLGCFAIIIYTV